jgi:hypothetical protein
MRAILLATVFVLSGCGKADQPFTLYRNSNIDPTLRIHFATFNAAESDQAYNLTNCQMAARTLNSNIKALAKAEGREPPVGLGFWCEPGTFKSDGRVPMSFDAEYPTSV